MKHLITSVLAAVLFAAPHSVLAWGLGDEDADKDSPYKGSSGSRYQYDLSKPIDQIRYETDMKAQMRDYLSVDPKRELDRDLGQYGGGIRR